MSAGDTSPGRRGPDVPPGAWAPLLRPGEYVKDLASGVWYCCTPNGHHGSLAQHEVTEHGDGTITVSPSILVSMRNSKGNNQQLWHGFLERGVWREV